MSGAIRLNVKEAHYLNTIKAIRINNFNRNLPFLILSDKLPDGQVYREFSDGHIELQEVTTKGTKFQYRVVQTLSGAEADRVRKEHGIL